MAGGGEEVKAWTMNLTASLQEEGMRRMSSVHTDRSFKTSRKNDDDDDFEGGK
jgi:hypothetical protein